MLKLVAIEMSMTTKVAYAAKRRGVKRRCGVDTQVRLAATALYTIVRAGLGQAVGDRRIFDGPEER